MIFTLNIPHIFGTFTLFHAFRFTFFPFLIIMIRATYMNLYQQANIYSALCAILTLYKQQAFFLNEKLCSNLTFCCILWETFIFVEFLRSCSIRNSECITCFRQKCEKSPTCYGTIRNQQIAQNPAKLTA